ncbi:hypothetical protein N657DRAFT_642046 [Parathielavia appendiculata]|uniref:Ribosomal protein bL31m N-terminal domain-containing protein n=1 Tax=Parathielavia appendiculata TaxID=2587402 RepID=A0AAN6Z7K8_9PEZI|nr:hypothetical protein N657DRAFT_642046 [Parathielavia appendiculata]
MGKLPSTVFRRPSLAGCLPTTSPSLTHPPSATAVPLPQNAATAAHQVRHATFVLRHRRPYQFTQLVQLSDGSTFTVRTTSPLALYKSAKDSRNHILWQPTEKSLRNVEVDEAGKLAAFRERFGTVWDLENPAAGPKQEVATAATAAAEASKEGEKAVRVEKAGGQKKGDAKVEVKDAAAAQEPTQVTAAQEDPFDSLVDLISSYATEDKNIKGGLSAKDQARKDKSGKKK